MGVRIKIATSPTEIDGVFRARHAVYVEEEGYMQQQPDGRILDRFDAFPTTKNFIASVKGDVVGSMRITEDSPAGTSTDTFFDFRGYLPHDATSVATASQLCMRQEYRSIPGTTFAMMGMLYYWAVSQGMSHLKAVGNPDIAQMLFYSGWEPVAPQFFHEEHKLQCLPIMLDLRKLNDRFLTFIREQNIEHFLSSFERQFHRAGEIIIQAGDEGQEAFILIDGQAEVVVGDPTSPNCRVIKELTPGEIFGEVTVLTNRRRTATVVARSDVNLMVLERSAFEDQLVQNPAAAIQMLRVLGSRLADTLDVMAR